MKSKSVSGRNAVDGRRIGKIQIPPKQENPFKPHPFRLATPFQDTVNCLTLVARTYCRRRAPSKAKVGNPSKAEAKNYEKAKPKTETET